MAWKKATTESRVKQAAKDLDHVEVVDLTREFDLATASIPLNKAYRVKGVHSYLEIVNAPALLRSDASESERSHRRFLRYLHIFQRVMHQAILATTDVFKVDLQNQRLHLIVYKPYDDEVKRIAVSVTVADALYRLLDRADDLHAELPDTEIRVGIESGTALAVRNGTRGDRELLFLGNPANHAAKLLAGPQNGLYLGAEARKVMGSTFATRDAARVTLTKEHIDACVRLSGLSLDVERMLKTWKDELAKTPLAEFAFSRPTPPLTNLDIDTLSPQNSRRIESAAVMADIDGFTRFVADRMNDDKKAGEAIRILHVFRKEIRDILNEFGGRKIRYIGDCLQGVIAEGDRSTDAPSTVQSALWSAAAMRDALDVIRDVLPDSAQLGLGIGVDFGPLSITRLGVKGSRDRCVAGRAMLDAQTEGEACKGTETAIGQRAYDSSSAAVQEVFRATRRLPDLTTNRLDALLTEAEGKVGKRASIVDSSGHTVTLPRAHADA